MNSFHNPPLHMLESEVAPFPEWFVYQALMTANLELVEASATKLGEETFLVRLVVENSGYLSTATLLSLITGDNYKACGLDGHHRKLMLRPIDHIAANNDTHIIFVSHSAGEVPVCINQHLVFEPRDDGFMVVCQM